MRSLTFSPGLRALARYPGKASYFLFRNPEGVAEICCIVYELFQSYCDNQRGYPGRCPGLQFANAFRRSSSFVNPTIYLSSRLRFPYYARLAVAFKSVLQGLIADACSSLLLFRASLDRKSVV